MTHGGPPSHCVATKEMKLSRLLRVDDYQEAFG